MRPVTRRLDTVLAAIDTANSADPHHDADGSPVELLYGQRMSAELARLFPDASGICGSPPTGSMSNGGSLPATAIRRVAPAISPGAPNRRGATPSALMASWPTRAIRRRIAPASPPCCARRIKRNPETQALEDVICFVFLRWYFADFAAKHAQEDILRIVAKTARKMSPEARARALGEFDLPAPLAEAMIPDATT